jgi:cysteine-rich repeat protein
MFHPKNQQGVLILLALVMTMVLLVSSSVIATITIRESRISGIVDKGLTAFYSGESAAESALFDIFKNAVDAETLDGTSGTSSSGATWERTSIIKTDEFVTDYIPSGGLKTIYIYNLDNVGGAGGVTSLNATWSSGSQMRVDIMTWDGAALTGPTVQNLSCSGTDCVGSISLNAAMAYQLDFVVTGTSVSDLILEVAPSGTLVDTSPTIVVQSEFQGAKQAVEVSLPQTPPWNQPATECGNSITETSEQCDDGNADAGDGCSATCQLETDCGDGNQEGVEQCDDGNITPGDGCDQICRVEAGVCGNGLIETGEECDGPDAFGYVGACGSDCLLAQCFEESFAGDNVLHNGYFNVNYEFSSSPKILGATYYTEWTDTEDMTFDCIDQNNGGEGDCSRFRDFTASNTYSEQANGDVNYLLGDGQGVYGTGCSGGGSWCYFHLELTAGKIEWCKGGLCGNNIVEAGENCDDGDTSDNGACTQDCSAITTCGDSIRSNPNSLAFAEECDDGDTDDEDLCDNQCLVNCNNGELNALEQCETGINDDYGCYQCKIFGNGISYLDMFSNGTAMVTFSRSYNQFTRNYINFDGQPHTPGWYPGAGSIGYNRCEVGSMTIDSQNNLYCIAPNFQNKQEIWRYLDGGTDGAKVGTVSIYSPNNGYVQAAEAEIYNNSLWFAEGYSLLKLGIGGGQELRIGKTIGSGYGYTAGSNNGEFNNARGLGIGPNGTVYVADGNNQRIQVYSQSGSFQRTINIGSYVADVAADNNHIYVAAYSTVKKYTTNGAFVTEWPADSAYKIKIRTTTGTIMTSEAHPTVTNAGILREYSTTGTLLNSIE